MFVTRHKFRGCFKQQPKNLFLYPRQWLWQKNACHKLSRCRLLSGTSIHSKDILLQAPSGYWLIKGTELSTVSDRIRYHSKLFQIDSKIETVRKFCKQTYRVRLTMTAWEHRKSARDCFCLHETTLSPSETPQDYPRPAKTARNWPW